MSTLTISNTTIPRLSFGLGSLMKWAPNHAHPLPTDITAETNLALVSGYRHFNTGDLYTTNESAASALRFSGLKRSEVCISLKLNTYAVLGCRGPESVRESAKAEIARFGLDGFVDVLMLHFPPRGYGSQMDNREAWRVLEGLKEEGLARVIGVSNWTLSDYHNIMSAPDLKCSPQVNEYEFNPFLLSDPEFQALRAYEREHGIIPINYGILTAISSRVSGSALIGELDRLSEQYKLSQGAVLLSWAYHRLDGIVVTTSSKEERMKEAVELFANGESVISESDYERIEEAARRDGYDGKRFYGHPHMEKARKEAEG